MKNSDEPSNKEMSFSRWKSVIIKSIAVFFVNLAGRLIILSVLFFLGEMGLLSDIQHWAQQLL
ncbi:MAG: hypothetical protein AAF668_14155 [Pseudomonadota bacterium]